MVDVGPKPTYGETLRVSPPGSQIILFKGFWLFSLIVPLADY